MKPFSHLEMSTPAARATIAALPGLRRPHGEAVACGGCNPALQTGRGHLAPLQAVRWVSRARRGFTLIEVMVVVAILAILSAIALPGYGSYITRQKLVAAQSDLQALSMNMENYLQNTTQYPSASGSIDSTAALKTTLPGWNPAASADFRYQVTAVSNSAQPPTYTLQAIGTTGNVSGCVVTLSSANLRTLAGCSVGGSTW
ncbi:MAG: prepilin-type N-terminal cleavage/methylation domain-containing protein [Pseudomonadota bacterium]